MTGFQLTPRVIAIGTACGALLCVIVYCLHLRGEIAVAKAQAEAAQARAAIFEAQAKLATSAGAIGEARDRNTAQAIAQAKEAEDDIQKAPDLDGAFAAFRAGIDSVRASGRGALADAQPDGGGSHPGG